MRLGPSPERTLILREARALVRRKRMRSVKHPELSGFVLCDELVRELDDLIELSERACEQTGRLR